MALEKAHSELYSPSANPLSHAEMLAQCANKDTRLGRDIREFVSYNYRELAIDIVNGSGSYLVAINSIINRHQPDRKQINQKQLTEIKKELLNTSNPAVFANHLATLFSCLPD